MSADIIEEQKDKALYETQATDQQIETEDNLEQISAPRKENMVAGPSVEKDDDNVKLTRGRWTDEEKTIVLKFFKTNVKRHIAPQKMNA